MPTATAAPASAQARSFALRAIACGGGVFAALRVPWVEAHLLLPLTEAQGRAAARLSGTAALPVDVTLACSGADVLAMCAGAILAYPAPWRARAAGAAGGIALILALNTLRIGTLARVAGSPASFETLHLYVWPWSLVLAVAAYVFAWMRVAARHDGEPAPVQDARVPLAPATPPMRRFVVLTIAFIVVFGAASPLYLDSRWVLAAAVAIAGAAAAILSAAGVAAVAAGNVVATQHGPLLVTQECIVTPLLPVYAAAAVAFAGSRRRTVIALAAALPLFMALGVARMLVIALPPAIAGSPLFLIHAFYQLLTACVLICAVAVWRHGTGANGRRRAAAGLAAGSAALSLLIAPARAVFGLPAFADPQGAAAMLPAFQIALFAALWVAVSAPAAWRSFASGVAILGLSVAAVFAALQSAAFAPGVAAVRAWAVGAPLALFAGLVMHGRPRR